MLNNICVVHYGFQSTLSHLILSTSLSWVCYGYHISTGEETEVQRVDAKYQTEGFLGGSVVKNPPVKLEIWVQSLGWEGPLEKRMATCSSILAWEIPWTEEPGGLQSMELQRFGPNLATRQQQLEPESKVLI